MADYSEIADDWTYRPEDLGTPETRYYYMKDALGSVMGLIGSHEDATPEFHLYYAYGNSNSTSVQGNPYHFTARRMDKFGGTPYIQFNRHRYYDSDIGRWLTPDPLGIVPNGQMGNRRFGPGDQYRDGMGLYEYVRSSPMNGVDPLGLWSEPTTNPLTWGYKHEYFTGLTPTLCERAMFHREWFGVTPLTREHPLGQDILDAMKNHPEFQWNLASVNARLEYKAQGAFFEKGMAMGCPNSFYVWSGVRIVIITTKRW